MASLPFKFLPVNSLTVILESTKIAEFSIYQKLSHNEIIFIADLNQNETFSHSIEKDEEVYLLVTSLSISEFRLLQSVDAGIQTHRQ